MRAYLIRHGHAVPGDSYLPDTARWLSFGGRATVAQVGAVLAERGVEFDAVVTSPLVRAVQTAELVAGGTGFGAEIECLLPLGTSGRYHDVPAELRARGVSVAAVGHEPTISAIAAALAGRKVVSSFRPGQVVCIEDGRPAWTLLPDRFEVRSL